MKRAREELLTKQQRIVRQNVLALEQEKQERKYSSFGGKTNLSGVYSEVIEFKLPENIKKQKI